MRNKKGFTLIELLAVIVILAIIMVIAVPQIINIINISKDKAWDENVSMIRNAIQHNIVLSETGMAEGEFTTIEAACSPNVSSIISSITKYENTTIGCTKNNVSKEYTFELTGTGHFDNKSKLIICDESGYCSIQNNNNESNNSNETPTQNQMAYYWRDVSESGYGDGGTIHQFSGWHTSLNPESKVYIKTSGILPEVCGVFSNGTVCMTSSYYNSDYSSAGSYSSDFSSCSLSNKVTYSGTGSTCIKGYTKTKADEMLSKGSSSCTIYANGSLRCFGEGNMRCYISNEGYVSCRGDSGESINIRGNGSID